MAANSQGPFWVPFPNPEHHPFSKQYTNLYHKFWGQDLNFQEIEVEDDEGEIQRFKTLNIGEFEFGDLRRTAGSLVVREEYERAFDVISRRYSQSHLADTGVIVVGPSGIGKSWFMFYLLIKALSLRQTVILNLNPKDFILLFHTSGCYRFTGTYISDLMSPMIHGAWALLDSDLPEVRPNTLLTASCLPIFMIYPSYPDEGRYEVYISRNRAVMHVMANWTLDELWAGALLRTLTPISDSERHDRTEFKQWFDRYGPDLHILYLLFDDGITPSTLDQQMSFYY